ncbi:MAG: UDP-N-acetylmuramyl-tripeptide synthetase, partial [Cyanobacteriota bacterium]|nr:UDP-N-acetylmuramyl-tripeptide synthetase [Cyanobacteriota bacterium]
MTQLLHPLLRHVGLEPPEAVPNADVKQVSCDSRRQGPGSLFVGLPGSHVDGGSFWPEALAAGAVTALIGEEAAAARPPAPGDPVIVVPAPLARWAGLLAAEFWQQPSQRLTLIGVTGTNGKTTTTHLIEHLATGAGHLSALFGTLVNRWPGQSVTAQHTTAFADLLQAQLAEAAAAGAQIAAMEVSSHALDQQRVAGCRFAGAVFTNLTQDHLDYHPSMEAYFEAKASLFSPGFLELKPGQATAVVNVDDPWGEKLAQRLGAHAWRSSLQEGSDAELRMEQLQFSSEGVSGVLVSPMGSGAFQSPLLGRFNLMNQLQAVGALLQQGLPLANLLQGLTSFRGVP